MNTNQILKLENNITQLNDFYDFLHMLYSQSLSLKNKIKIKVIMNTIKNDIFFKIQKLKAISVFQLDYKRNSNFIIPDFDSNACFNLRKIVVSDCIQDCYLKKKRERSDETENEDKILFSFGETLFNQRRRFLHNQNENEDEDESIFNNCFYFDEKVVNMRKKDENQTMTSLISVDTKSESVIDMNLKNMNNLEFWLEE